MIASLCILILACIYIYFFPFIPKRKKHYTYALLLGCPAHDDGTMSSSQIKRCDLAIKAYQQNLYDTLIISGSNVKNEFIEAKVMHAYIQNKMDIPTILETNARNTFENFKFSKDIIQKQDVLILTSQTTLDQIHDGILRVTQLRAQLVPGFRLVFGVVALCEHSQFIPLDTGCGQLVGKPLCSTPMPRENLLVPANEVREQVCRAHHRVLDVPIENQLARGDRRHSVEVSFELRKGLVDRCPQVSFRGGNSHRSLGSMQAELPRPHFRSHPRSYRAQR